MAGYSSCLAVAFLSVFVQRAWTADGAGNVRQCDITVCDPQTRPQGLGELYEWHTLEEGLQLTQKTGKPLMLIIHKSWCGACKALKPKFAGSAAALELSKHFVMVNTMDKEEPKESKYEPDGGYIPRILFIDSKGDVRPEIYNKNGNPDYKFFYHDDKTIVESMKQAKELLTAQTDRGNEL